MSVLRSEGFDHFKAGEMIWPKVAVVATTKQPLFIETPHTYFIGYGPVTVVVEEDRTTIYREYLP